MVRGFLHFLKAYMLVSVEFQTVALGHAESEESVPGRTKNNQASDSHILKKGSWTWRLKTADF